MRFKPGNIEGLYLIELEKHEDERGFFARSFCASTGPIKDMGFHINQCNISFNTQAFTLRGLHYQAFPKLDPKIVRCLRGKIYDVAVDLRPQSKTYLNWYGAYLDGYQRDSLLIPGGCAHGFLTLEDNSELLYLMGEEFDPDLARGQRWDDPAFGIQWPSKPLHINQRDKSYPDYQKL